jgi:hypothetical protein
VNCIEKELLVKGVERKCGKSVPVGIEPDEMFIEGAGPLQHFVGEGRRSKGFESLVRVHGEVVRKVR